MDAKHACIQEKVVVLADETRNKEGYKDMVPYLAIKDMSRKESWKSQKGFGFRPVVFICSPYSGEIETNAENARRYSRFAVDNGMIPFAPHLLLPQYMDDSKKEEHELALFMGSVFLDKCAELWVFGSRASAGMAAEIQRAKLKDKRIRYFDNNLNETKGLEGSYKQEAAI